MFFGGTLLPVLGFLHVYPFRYSYVADHFQYLASVGVIVPLAVLMATAAPRGIRGKYLEWAATGLLALVLGALSWNQTHIYKDATTLYRSILARNPNSWMAHNNLGLVLLEDPNSAGEAVAEFNEALRIWPNIGGAHNNLGIQLARTGHLPEAIVHFREAIRLEPRLANAHYNLGTALSQTPGQLPAAITEYEAALKLDPSYAEAHCNLGIALLNTPGRWVDGFSEMQEALSINPELQPARRIMSRLAAIAPQ
jgi:tetratricopeptide (TPR) repeat protein